MEVNNRPLETGAMEVSKQSKKHIKSITLKQDYLSLPSEFTWENIQPFSLITGLNGVGKTQLLEIICRCRETYSLTEAIEGKMVEIRFSNDPNNKFSWDEKDIQYIKYNETLSSQFVPRSHLVYSVGEERYKECIVLLFLKGQLYDCKKKNIDKIFPNIQHDTDRYLNRQFIKDNEILLNNVQCILCVIKESEKTAIIKKHIIAIIDEFSKRLDNDSKLQEFKINTGIEKQFINRVYECLSSYLPAASHFKKNTMEIVTIPDEINPNMERAVERYIEPAEKNIQELLDDWFRIYCGNRQKCILNAFTHAQKNRTLQLSIVDTLSLLPISPWELLNDKIKQYGKNYGFKHTIEVPDMTVSGKTITCEFEDEKGNTISFQELSSGEQIIFQIILIACNIYIFGYTPKCLLLDEPDSHLHASIAKVLVGMIQDLLVDDMGMQVIMTTHQATTVALAPKNSVFEMERNSQKVSIKSVAQSQAVDTLTDSLLVVAPKDHKLVFTEDMDDAHFYQRVFDHAMLEGFFPEPITLYFMTAARSAGGSGGCAAVEEIVRRLRLGKTDPKKGKNINLEKTHQYVEKTPQKHFICGLIDKDSDDKKDEVIGGVYKVQRNEVENFECDAFLIVYGLFESIINLKDISSKSAFDFSNMQTYIDRFIEVFGIWLSLKEFGIKKIEQKQKKKKKTDSSNKEKEEETKTKESGEINCVSIDKEKFIQYFLYGDKDESICFKTKKRRPENDDVMINFWQKLFEKEFSTLLDSNSRIKCSYIANNAKEEIVMKYPRSFVYSKAKAFKILLNEFVKAIVGEKIETLFEKGLKKSGYFPSDLLGLFKDIQYDGLNRSLAITENNVKSNLNTGSPQTLLFKSTSLQKGTDLQKAKDLRKEGDIFMAKSNIQGYKEAEKKYKEAIHVLKNVPGKEAKNLLDEMTECVNVLINEFISPYEPISLGLVKK